MKIDLSQIIEKFNKLDIKARYGIFAGILLLIFLLDFFTILGFQLGSFQKIDTQNQTLQQDIDGLKSSLQRIDQMKASLQNSRGQLEAMNAKIRPMGDVSSILEDISRLAGESNVKIDQISPQGDAQPLITSGTIKYYALPIVIQATSGYHIFGHFLNQLESQKLFFSLSNLTIEDQVGNDARHHTISATLKVVLSDKNTGGQLK